jgi:hypothetical protein
MVAISEWLRVCYGFASPKNRAKAAAENALDRPQIGQTKSNQERIALYKKGSPFRLSQ